MGWSSFVAYVPSRDVSVVGLANRSRHTSHVMDATRSLVLGVVGDPVSSPILERSSVGDVATEVTFFVLPLLLCYSILWLAFKLAAGPGRNAVEWYAALLTGGTLYLFAVSLFDFFERAVVMSPPLLLAGAIGLFFHRRRLEWSFRAAWADSKRRKGLLTQLFAVGVIIVVSGPITRRWACAFVVSQGVLLYILAGRRPKTVAAGGPDESPSCSQTCSE